VSVNSTRHNMFRMLLHPSSGACALFVALFHGLCCFGSMCVGVTVWFGWGGVVPTNYAFETERKWSPETLVTTGLFKMIVRVLTTATSFSRYNTV